MRRLALRWWCSVCGDLHGVCEAAGLLATEGTEQNALESFFDVVVFALYCVPRCCGPHAAVLEIGPGGSEPGRRPKCLSRSTVKGDDVLECRFYY